MASRDRNPSSHLAKWMLSYARYKYPIFKFLMSFWLIPLVQVCAIVFSRKSENRNAPTALIVTSRFDQMSSSFSCLVPQLKKESVNVICHSVNHAKTGTISKIGHIYNFFSACKHADFVFLDDTFLPVSYALKSKWVFKPRVVQLWHSAGLFKQVGLDVTQGSLLRYLMKKNFQNFDLVAVSSEACRDAIAGFMGLDKERVVALGTSYTDRYFSGPSLSDKTACQPEKKTLVYAPTFRGDAFKVRASPIPQVKHVLQAVESDFDCFICPHPHEITDVGTYKYPVVLADTLDKIDILITDYSSIAMDYILANPSGKLVLFVPDVEEYEKSAGFYVPLADVSPHIAHDKAALTAAIQSNERHDYTLYSEKYLTLCDGNATARLLTYLGIREH